MTVHAHREHRCPNCRSWDVVSSTSNAPYSSGLPAGEQHRYWCAMCEWEVYEGEHAYDDYLHIKGSLERDGEANDSDICEGDDYEPTTLR